MPPGAPDPERVIVALLGDLGRQGAAIEQASAHLAQRVHVLEARIAGLHDRRASAEWWAMAGAVAGLIAGALVSLLIHGVAG